MYKYHMCYKPEIFTQQNIEWIIDGELIERDDILHIIHLTNLKSMYPIICGY